MPVAFTSTRTSPARGPSSCTVMTSNGLPASNATAARTSMSLLHQKGRIFRQGPSYSAGRHRQGKVQRHRTSRRSNSSSRAAMASAVCSCSFLTR
ncbi:hypothetical protein BMJ35_12765 [Sinorhizobium medicae]|nr:hypothetical protein BMJ35_12765 [Sinorhizobium medicae]